MNLTSHVFTEVNPFPSPSPHLPISPSPHLPISPSPHLPYPLVPLSPCPLSLVPRLLVPRPLSPVPLSPVPLSPVPLSPVPLSPVPLSPCPPTLLTLHLLVFSAPSQYYAGFLERLFDFRFVGESLRLLSRFVRLGDSFLSVHKLVQYYLKLYRFQVYY
ncbi:hypothetical protein PCC9214_04886 [Planktothrix tepida]|nr:hypothetical protein PCC9214_04886 [Planktothrix tepida]